MEVVTRRFIRLASLAGIGGNGASMKLHRIILTKSDLAALPQTERSLLLLLGHASNETPADRNGPLLPI